MGLRLKFNLVIVAAFAIGLLVASIVLNRVFIESAREQVLQNARIMMTAANGIRSYTQNDLAPLLPIERDGKFVPETVPAFAAQKNFRQIQDAFPGFRIGKPPSIRLIWRIELTIGRRTSSMRSATSRSSPNS